MLKDIPKWFIAIYAFVLLIALAFIGTVIWGIITLVSHFAG